MGYFPSLDHSLPTKLPSIRCSLLIEVAKSSMENGLPLTLVVLKPSSVIWKRSSLSYGLWKKNTFTVRQNSSIFTHYIRQHSISSEEFMVSFDMKSLFTSIPVNSSLTITKERLQRDQNLAEHTNLSVENILRLSDLVLNHNYFKYDGNHYKQIWLCDGFSHWSCFRWPGNGRNWRNGDLHIPVPF